jgi:hypothetical protein
MLCWFSVNVTELTPCCCSCRLSCLRDQGVGWHHTGSRVAYYANSIRRGRRGTYHTLTFTLTLRGSPGDWVHLAHYYPYTFTDLQRSLAVLMAVSGPWRAQLAAHATNRAEEQPMGSTPAISCPGWACRDAA